MSLLYLLCCQGQQFDFALQNYRKNLIYARKMGKNCMRRIKSRQMDEEERRI